MDIIIAGDGEVGMHLAEALERSDHNITIVDPHEELLKMMESHSDLMTIAGDSTSIKTLQKANVKKADMVIAVLHDEHINLLTGILAKKLGAKRVIVRVNTMENLSPESWRIYQDRHCSSRDYHAFETDCGDGGLRLRGRKTRDVHDETRGQRQRHRQEPLRDS